MPKVTILIPIYNVEKFLRQCLDSVVGQTMQDIEIICINDGSTDSSGAILEEYAQKDGRIKVINKENSGYGASMNLGLASASGEYIGIVEPDDFVKKEMFSDLYNLAIKHDADVVKSDYYEFTTKENQSRKSGKISRCLANRVINAKEEPKILRIIPTIWSAIYKRNFLNENNIYFLETPGASYQDTSFAFKVLSLAEKIVFTVNAYLFYRTDNENSSVNSADRVYAICDEFVEITKFLDDNPYIKKFANDVKLIKEYDAYVWNAKRIAPKFRRSFVERFAEIFKNYEQKGELKEVFYKKHSRAEIKTLIEDTKLYRKMLREQCKQEKLKKQRRKKFSVRINSSRVSIVIAGKKVVEI